MQSSLLVQRWAVLRRVGPVRALSTGQDYSRFLTEQAYIDGKFCDSESKCRFEVYNPANGQLVGDVAQCTLADTRRAVEAAKRALPEWTATTGRQRSDLLLHLYRLQMENAEALAKLITVEMGKPIRESRGEIAYGASFFRWFSEEAPRVHGEILQSPWKDRDISYRKEAIGVAGIITPWNFPNAMITRKLGAALAAGCTVVVKPAEDTPYSALAIAQLAHQAGIPPGVVNVLPTSRQLTPEIGNFLCDTPDISVISFTGSTEVGKHLIKRGADSVKRVCLELGGDAPFIVFESANLEAAVAGCIASKFRNAGQTCVCSNRIFVHESVYDQFVQMLSRQMSSELVIGDGLEESCTVGPLINERAVAKVANHIEDAVSKGATVITGGKKVNPHDDQCFYFEPTILAHVSPDMLVLREETFGPIAPVFKFRSEEEVLLLANSSRRGLAGYFYSRDYAQIHRVARHLQVGMVGINEGIISAAEAPFGGIKESGMGREGGPFGVDEFLNIKYICLGGLH